MNSRKSVWLAAGLIVLCTAAAAQQSAERYVPIGESPGISGSQSVIGEITAVDSAVHTITVKGDHSERTFRMAEDTRIWLDRSNWRRPNLVGTFYDCVVGRDAEVMYAKDDMGTARWVKVEARELHEPGDTD
jgi:hypothetical protein